MFRLICHESLRRHIMIYFASYFSIFSVLILACWWFGRNGPPYSRQHSRWEDLESAVYKVAEVRMELRSLQPPNTLASIYLGKIFTIAILQPAPLDTMKPVKIADFSEGRLTKHSVLLLNVSILGLRYATQLLTRPDTNACILSKGGIAMPNEIWTMILDFAREDVEDRFYFVKAHLITASPKTMLLRCYRHEFDHPEDALLAGGLKDIDGVNNFELYIAYASKPTAEGLGAKPPELRQLFGPDSVFDVTLDATSTDQGLYIFHVPDVIAIVDKGRCWLCNAERFFCPGCTGTISDNFNAYIGCGGRLACPLCMGIQLSVEHMDYIDEYAWEQPPEHRKEEMLKLLEKRLEELGYTDVDVPENAWGGNFRRLPMGFYETAA